MTWKNDKVAGTNDRGIIHLVDDERDIVLVASSLLEQNGYTVHSFTSASEAIRDISRCGNRVSILITDVRMPEYSGFQVARATRDICPDIPIVFMTAFEMSPPEFDKLFPSLRINHFLQKPFHGRDLLQVVKKYVPAT